jgi:N-methylhydantoinase A/acetophenone carboxylase
MDAIRYFERSRRLNLLIPGTQALLTDYDAFNSVVVELQKEALKELDLEGLPTSSLLFNLELDMKFGGQIHHLRIGSPRLFLENEEGVKAIYEQFAKDYAQVFSPYSVYPGWGVEIHNFALKATVPFPKFELPAHGFKGETPPADSLKGKRDVYWKESGGFKLTNVYAQELLECGNILEGPAVIEAEHTTIVLPPGTKITVSKYMSGEIEKI